MALEEVTDQNFDDIVSSSDLPVLVDFWAAWCQPCRKLAPILEDMSQEMGDRLRIVKMDVDANPKTATAAGVTGLPTLNLYKNGEVVKSITGAKPKQALLDEIEPMLG